MADNETFNNSAALARTFAFDDIGGIKHQRVKLEHGADGSATDVSVAAPLPVIEGRTYGYAAGTVAGTIDVPAAGRLKRVSVVAGVGGATITIGGGGAITLAASGAFDEQIPGEAVGADVVIGGDADAYYVSWVV